MKTERHGDLLRKDDQKALVLLLACSLLYFVGLTILSPRQLEPQDVSASLKTSPTFQVDLNTAEEAELLLLPGIGETLAKRIIEYRNENGPFKRNEDIILIKGIGPGKAAEILPILATNNGKEPETQRTDAVSGLL